MFLSHYYCLALIVSFHQCSVLICILVVSYLKEKRVKRGNVQRKHCCSGYRGALDRTYFDCCLKAWCALMRIVLALELSEKKHVSRHIGTDGKQFYLCSCGNITSWYSACKSPRLNKCTSGSSWTGDDAHSLRLPWLSSIQVIVFYSCIMGSVT